MKVIEVNNSMVIWKTKNRLNIDILHCECCEFKDVTEFWVKWDQDIIDVIIRIEVYEFIDEIAGVDSILNKKNEWNFLASYNNVIVNQKWKFIFSGKLKNTNEPFNSIVYYKI